MRSGGKEATEVVDGDIDTAHMVEVKNGERYRFTTGFGVQDAQDLALTVEPGFGDGAIWST